MRTTPDSIRHPRVARLSPIAAALAVALSQGASAAAPAMQTGGPALRDFESSGPFVVARSAPLPGFMVAQNSLQAKLMNAPAAGTGTSPAGRGERIPMGVNGIWVSGASANLITDLTGDATRYFAYGDFGGSVSQPFVSFGRVLVGSTSPTSSIIIRSTGADPYEIYGMDNFGFDGFCYGVPSLGAASRALISAVPTLCYGGPFICDTTCDTYTPYVTGESSCRVNARFAPLYPSTESMTICIYDNTADSPKSILLTGEGILPPPITVRPSRWDFGPVLVGDSSREKEFTITRSADDNRYLVLTEIHTTGPFELIETDCFDNQETLVQASHFSYGEECTAVVAFEPTRAGSATGRLVVQWEDWNCECNDYGGDVATTLRGTGLVGGELTLPESIEVGAAHVGGGPISKTVEVLNSGTTPVIFSSIVVSAPFTLVNNCPETLPAAVACSLTIGFTAPAVGSFNGTLTVASNADDGTAAIPVHATGQFIAEPILVIEPNAVGFGDRVIGSSTDSTRVTITNVGGVAATLSLGMSSVDYLIGSNTCGAILAPAASCFADVAFRPIGFGLRPGSLVVTSNAANSPQSVNLHGTGCRPFVPSDRSGSDSNCAP